MPFVGDTFGLNSVYEKQVTNVESNNFASWPESGTYGYFGGGGNPTRVSTITRLDFSNETVSAPGKNLPSVRDGAATVSSSSYGYFGGGYSPPFINTITRLDFSNENISNPGKDLPTSRTGLSAVSSNSYGYFGGGYTPPLVFLNTITRLDFSNETVSNPGKNLLILRQSLSAISGSFNGYFAGGSNPGGNVANLDRLNFSDETSTNIGSLPTSRASSTGVSNSN
jgi:hypothetical protein